MREVLTELNKYTMTDLEIFAEWHEKSLAKHIITKNAQAGAIIEFAKYYHKKKLTIPVVGCQREQLKTTKEPLPYDEWKKHLKIQKPNNQIYQIGDEYITLNEVLEMYEDYYHSF